MRFTTRTEYGLISLAAVARRLGEKRIFAVKEIAQAEKYSIPYIEKIFQRLKRAGIVKAHPGKQGGFSLTRHPSQITLKEIVEALEGSTFDVFCQPIIREEIVCTHLCLCGMKPIWMKTKRLLDEYYDSITLEMIAHNRTIPGVLAPVA